MSVFSFITGPAGTGKTFRIHAEADQDPTAVLCATTGIAAVNCGGTTINALLRYFDTHELARIFTSKTLHTRLRSLRDHGVCHLLLDEVSMLSGTQLTYLIQAITAVNLGSSRPITLTLVGDFAQLPPINEPFAFESEEWGQVTPHVTHLTEIYRQTDRDFVEALGAVRRGDHHTALSYFGDRLSSAPLSSFDGTTLKARNVEVDTYNAVKLEQLPGRVLEFTSTKWRTPRAEWKHIPHNLSLKVGALVMILANKREPRSSAFTYVNGDLGIIQDQVAGSAVVQLVRTGEIVEVTMATRDNVVGAGKQRQCVGSVAYMPLRLAWASTVHKAQGLSLDQVQVDLRDRFFAHPHMLYVALSRARTPDGLRIVGTAKQFAARCVVDLKVRQWL